MSLIASFILKFSHLMINTGVGKDHNCNAVHVHYKNGKHKYVIRGT